MSVQLILYPQIASLNEFMVDALTFDTVNSSLNTNISTSGNPYTNIMSAAPPTISGAWYRFKNTINGSPATASASGGSLTLNSVSSSGAGTLCGVYQQLSGLVIGESYTITVNMAPANGFIVLNNYSGQIGGPTSSISANATQASANFTALSNNDTIFISYLNTGNDDLVISSIAITGKTSIKDWEGQAICDLYENEEIPLTLSVDDFKNVAEKIQSYSKDFNLPATKRNNKLFGNIFDITRTIGNPYDFNPYAQTRAVLKQNGFILFDGFLKLIDIQEREGEISYNVNLYAQTIALADTLKDRTFDLIDFSELEHTYSKVAIKGSWYTNGLPLTNALTDPNEFAGPVGATVTDVLKYPFVDWTGQILIANGATGNNSLDGFPELTSLEQAFRPFIKIKYLIDRIFSEAGYTYSSTLFDSSSFGKLFMDFNWGGDGIPSVVPNTTTTATYPKFQSVGSPPEIITDTAYVTAALIDSNSTGGNANSNVPSDYVTAAGANQYRIVCSTDGRFHNIDYSFTLENTKTGILGIANFRWVHYDDDAATTTYIDVQSQSIGSSTTNTVTFQGNIQIMLDQDDLLYPEFAGSGGSPSGSGNWLRQDYSFTGPTGSCTFNISTSTVTSSVLNSLRGEINQWEFLKGIFTMFNLVTLQDKSDPANIIIKTYSDVFIKNTQGTTLKDRGINFDWTDKVDLKDIKLTPLNDLKKRTIFRYEEEEEDYIFRMYKKSTRGHLYGSKVFSAQGLTLLEGDDEIVATPFAATVSKPLGQGFNEMIVPTIYSMNDDGTTSTFDNMPRILYNHIGASPVTMGSTTYYIPSQNGASSENSSLFFSFSHLSDIPTTLTTDDYNFGECQYIQPIGQTVTSNLFNNYWLPYYNQLYNPDTKTMTLKVNLTAGDIAEFEFSDYVMIKNRAYRVNRIDYKPQDLSTVEFILIP